MQRDVPHYLAPLKTTTTPNRLLFLYCTGVTRKRREHYETHFDRASLIRTWTTSRTRQQRSQSDTYTSPAALWSDVAAWCPLGRRVVLFTYDLAEQIRLAQLLTHLPQAGWELDKIVLERASAWCSLRNGKRTLLCCDLRSWAPVTLDKLATDCDIDLWYGKRDEPWADNHNSVSDRYCTVIRESVLQVLNWIQGENLGPFRPTGSGQSYSAYRRRFISHRLLVHDEPSRLAHERAAMHTGRSEAWRHGTYSHGTYYEYDIHSAYATIGKDCEVPTIARREYTKCTVTRLERLLQSSAVMAHVTVSTEVECVPCQISGRTLWPVGTFSTTLWDPELRLALQYATDIKVNHVWTYDREPALAAFCTYVLENMEGQTQVYGLVPQRVLKHWSRCLVGRLGLRYRTWHDFAEQHPPDVRLDDYWDLVDNIKTEMLTAGTKVMILGDMTEARESLPQVPGWVMSECRRRLWEQMRRVGFNDMMYVDTDSVITSSAVPFGRMVQHLDTYGTIWRRKGEYRNLSIAGPRNLTVGDNRRISGIPLWATQTAPLEYDGEVMRSVKSSMRNGDLNMIVSVPRRFHVQNNDPRRQHNEDGSTLPFRLEMACS